MRASNPPIPSVSATSASSYLQVIVSHADQGEALARYRFSALAALAAGEQALEGRQVARTVRHLEHRADERADHAVQEGVRRHPVDEQVAAPLPGGLAQDPLEADVVGPRRGEGPEVVGAPEEPCGLLQEAEVQLSGDVDRTVAPERGAYGVVDDAVLVAPAPRVPAGVEAPFRLDAAPERQVLREHRGGLVGDQLGLQARLGLERDDLPARVHACVGAPGDAELYGVAQHGLQALGERPLDGPHPWLGSPTSEPRALVLHEAGVFLHSRIPPTTTSAAAARARASRAPKRSSR